MHDSTNNKAVFFDRDGIINHRKIGDYVSSVEEFIIIPEFFDLFREITSLGFITILVTNQQGIGKGLMSIYDLRIIHHHLQSELLRNTGAMFDDIRFCGSLSSENDFRRKPEPGMILEAAQQWKIDLQSSFIIGDMQSDIIAGNRAGVKTIFVGNPSDLTEVKPDFCFNSHIELIQSVHSVFVL